MTYPPAYPPPQGYSGPPNPQYPPQAAYGSAPGGRSTDWVGIALCAGGMYAP